MVRNYTRKTDRGKYGEENLAKALKAVTEGVPLIRASKEFGVPARTLRRHRDQQVAKPGTMNLGRYRSALPSSMELQLKFHVLEMEKRLYGLRIRDVQRLAFDVAEKAEISHPFNKESRMAGKDWVQGFLARHHLSIRQPQGTSIARTVGFNRPQVQNFFDLYRGCLEAKNYAPSRIWNMDETGLTTVQKPGKILASKGTRQVGKVTSAERGALVTLVCACNAAGVFMPPMYIFPRKRMTDTLMKGAPPQAAGFASPSGWTDSELFLTWLRHFTSFTGCSRQDPHIILLDGHHSHKTLAAIEFCRENGIELITLPPHSTHKMQPLDRTYFKPMKSAFNAEADQWMVTNPGRRITVYEMADLSGKAFLRTALPERAVHGFKTCGIWPFDPNIFNDADFEGAFVTDEQQPMETVEASNEEVPLPNPSPTAASQDGGPQVEGEASTRPPSDTPAEVSPSLPPASQPTPSTSSLPPVPQPTPSTSDQEIRNIIQTVSPIPKLAVKRPRSRKAESAAVLTSSPYKDALAKKHVLKTQKKQKGERKGKAKAGKGTKKKRLEAEESSDEEEDWPCIICCEPYSRARPREVWVECQSCRCWAHEDCTEGLPTFICPNCESDE